MASIRKRLFALTYDKVNERWERRLDEVRNGVVQRASGKVLELGGGTGRNLQFYAPSVDLTVVEPNPHMAERLEKRAEEVGLEVKIVSDNAEALSFEDDSFDAVVSTMMLCTVGDLGKCLSESRRVLKEGGGHFFFEHIAAPGIRGHAQRVINPVWGLFSDGCNIDRDILSEFDTAGFNNVEIYEKADMKVGPRLANPHVIGVAWK